MASALSPTCWRKCSRRGSSSLTPTRSPAAISSVPRKPTSAELAKAAGKGIRDVLAPRLRALFCGINPGLYSAATGHHFARPGNRFWPALHAAGFTPRVLHPSEQRRLLKGGYGITNLVNRATATADELAPVEFVSGRRRLADRSSAGNLRRGRDLGPPQPERFERELSTRSTRQTVPGPEAIDCSQEPLRRRQIQPISPPATPRSSRLTRTCESVRSHQAASSKPRKPLCAATVARSWTSRNDMASACALHEACQSFFRISLAK